MTFSDFLLHVCLRADILQTALVTVRLRPRRTDFTPVIHQAVAEIAAFLRWNQLPECHFHALRVLDSFHQPYPVYQYVEFFGKFYEGGGKAFRPFKQITKYVEIKED